MQIGDIVVIKPLTKGKVLDNVWCRLCWGGIVDTYTGMHNDNKN